MTDTTVFDPTDKKLEIRTGENQVSLHFGEYLVAHCATQGCDQWSDTKILAYFYLEALYRRGCVMNHMFSESIFTLILNTLHASGHDDFVSADWADVKYETSSATATSVAVYVTVTTTDGFDITLNYMTPGLAWQQLVVTHAEEVPTMDELYDRLKGKGNEEWTSLGTLIHDGIVYNYDAAATALFTMKNRLEIIIEGGDLIYSDAEAQGHGLIEVLMDLYRKLQLRMNYGEIDMLSAEHIQLVQSNLGKLLTDVFAMGEYLELADNTSHTIRGSVSEDILCTISHTYIAEAGKIRADFRFLTMAQNWSVERSEAFDVDGMPVYVDAVYNQHAAQIRAGLGLDVVDQPAQTLADIPFENREVGNDFVQPQYAEPVFTPVSNEELMMEDPDNAVAGDPLVVTAVAAVGPHGGIGMGSDLLWRIKEDLQFFKQVTTNHVVIMGRKTFESIGKPLPNRQNIVITRDPEYVLNLYTPENDQQYDNLHCATSIEEAVLLGGRLAAQVYGNNELMVIGGGEIYKEFLPMTSKVFLTYVKGDDSHADVYFPITSEDIGMYWTPQILAEGLEEDGVQYDRFVLTRKQ
ncbi:hypothetical protein pEaSNUABM37_00125 [Erwinia phage pEa_SNUABM_37]|nr:hypothetical protein pEaSNUABM37_00125 [Erwinia phage pEa_SNUABM_37]QXO10595.1 hypothetical protein pEaSNUABM48_00125 [Erwinia phage pEa_SNUABM_48]